MKTTADKISHLVPLVIIGIALSAGFFISVSDLPQKMICLTKQLLHFDCPGCGMTRAFLLIPRGNFMAALSFNAAAPALYVLLFIIMVTLMGRLSHKEFLSSLFWVRLRYSLAILVLTLVTVQWFVRIFVYFSEHSLIEYIRTFIVSSA